jgi:hypothetical protein
VPTLKVSVVKANAVTRKQKVAAAKKVAKVAVVKKALKAAAARKAPRANVAMIRKAKASVVKANAAVVPNKAGANA